MLAVLEMRPTLPDTAEMMPMKDAVRGTALIVSVNWAITVPTTACHTRAGRSAAATGACKQGLYEFRFLLRLGLSRYLTLCSKPTSISVVHTSVATQLSARRRGVCAA